MGFISFLRSFFSSPSPFCFSLHWAMSLPEDGIYFPKDSSVCKCSVLDWAGLIITHSSHYHRPRITKIQHCKRSDRVMHEFLIIEFTYPTSDMTLRTVPVIVERTMEIGRFRPEVIKLDIALSTDNLSHASVGSFRASSSCASIASSSSLSMRMPAFNYITTPLNGAPIESIDKGTTRPYDICRMLTFPPDTSVTDYNLAMLLLALHEYAPDYSLVSRQCYWFAATIYDVLRAAPRGSSVDHNVCHLRDLRDCCRRFLTIFTIQPKDLPLDNILPHYAQHVKDFESTARTRLEAAEAANARARVEAAAVEATNARARRLEDELALLQQQLAVQGYAGPSNRA